MSEREEFEAAAKARGIDVTPSALHPLMYKSPATNTALWAWEEATCRANDKVAWFAGAQHIATVGINRNVVLYGPRSSENLHYLDAGTEVYVVRGAAAPLEGKESK